MLVVIAVELVNLAILTTNHTIMDIIMNFLALVIIADFDDFFFQSVELEVMGNMIQEGRLELFYGTRELSDVLQTERTSSPNARFKIEQNRIDHSEKNHPTKAWKKNCEKGRQVDNMHFPKIDPDKIAAHRERMEIRMHMKKEKGPEERPEFIHVNQNYKDLGFQRWIYRKIYTFLRAFYASFWFYFMPFITIILCYSLPYAFNENYYNEDCCNSAYGGRSRFGF